ncbi:LysM peptidoglycan-binding domain-containing protein [Marinilactibacillus sp. Marseille-P9653]|uniref:LysM peptidoglycan-binding domain-containing protein n=1 Tax=Marinilactibacillus sp. Marseille-P9653 TaxID=2866583 RepID=UPI00272E2EC9|nr:LysM peptidoglycan-binding domain-containing protein [Marinilactibacillus sp. Marseille-P9653]
MINQKDMLDSYKNSAKKRSLKLTMSSSILAGVVAISAFGEAVHAEEMDLNKEEIQALYDQYNELQATVKEQQTLAPETEATELTEEVPTSDELEELSFVKSQLVRMIELAGGESLLAQLNVEQLSTDDLNTAFEALLTYQLEQSESAERIVQEELTETTETESVETTENIVEDTVVESIEVTEPEINESAKEETEDVIVEEVSASIENKTAEIAVIESSEKGTVESTVETEALNETVQEEVEESQEFETPVTEVEESIEETEKIEVVVPEEEVKPETKPAEEKPAPKPAETKPTPAPAEKPVVETKPEPKPEVKPTPTVTKPEVKAIVHTVKSGDTLNKIAKSYNTTVNNLVALNKISNPNNIKIGQKIAINQAGVSSTPASSNGSATSTGNLSQAKTTSEFINQIAGHAQRIAKENGIYASIMIAQASLESGYGKSTLSSPPNHNLFGIKGSYNGQSVAMRTKEYYSSTGWITITDNFKKYPSYAESLEDNARLIRNGTGWNSEFYSGAWIERTNSYKDASAWLQGRYATDPSYANKLNNIISLYDLTRFDGNWTGPVETGNGGSSTVKPVQPTTPTTGNNTSGQHTVVRGETLTSIARKYNTTVAAIKLANNLKSDLIFVNQKLSVSGATSGGSSNNGSTTPAPTPGNSQQTGSSSYTVVRGDTLTSIARRHNTSVSSIKSLNNLKSDLIFVNQKLALSGSTSNSGSVTPAPIPGSNQQTGSSSYTVVNGDTLTSIARRHNISISSIKSLNNLKSDLIFVNQKLTLSGTSQSGSTTPASNTGNSQQTGSSNYTVVSGDTLTSIARRFNTNVSSIKSLNNLKSDLIFVNQKLVLAGMSTGSVSNPVSPTTPTVSNYTVVSGDTLTSIARRFGTSVSAIKSANNLKSDAIFVNQTLALNGQNAGSSTTPVVNNGSSQGTTTSSYTVVSGDTLTSIARRFNTTVNAIKSLNNLETDQILVNQKLTVSGKASSTPVTNSPSVSAPTETVKSTYTVVAGDTLSGIARKFNTSVSTIKSLNDLNKDTIYVNQKLTINGSKAPVAPTPVVIAPVAPKPVLGQYSVVGGDTLTKIARQFNTSVNQLMQDNNLSSSNIFVGQTLNVAGAKVTPKPVIPAPVTPKPVNEQTSSIVVSAGDTLSALAAKYGTTVAQIKATNRLESDNIFVGQVLAIPAGRTQTVSTPVVSKPVSQPTQVVSNQYVVQSGDSLYKIALQFNTSVAQIKEWNNLTNDTIFVNQRLSVQSTEKVVEQKAPVTKSGYVVEKGDTLSGIALKFNTTIQQLKEKNALDSDVIYVNQNLSV